MLDKTFDAKTREPQIYQGWEASGQFEPNDDPKAEGFSIVIPPPNVTGSLHVGHALNNTLQDVLARFERMRGKAVLWLPGTDHAGIATQMVVERQLAELGNVGRRELGRDAFVAKVWEWKAQSGGTIVGQLRRLGASCDWSRERFTLDDGLSAAVRKVFVDLYHQGLIYRDKRLVNWDPQFQTAISDLEVEQRETDGAYYHFAYPLEDGSGEVVVATTRPDPMLGDTGVAVHPDDELYKGVVGKSVILPITGRRVPIVADAYADPEKGSGAVKITPAHDFNDFQVGKRHGLEAINILTETATLNDTVPEAYRGLDRFAARKKIVAQAEEEGWLRQIEKTRHMVPHGDRSGVVIEPFLTDQWYVNAGELAKEAIAAVEDERTVFEPRHWEKTYFEWMRNIEPWCISRQLWWGHRIPAWYGPKLDSNGEPQYCTGLELFVADDEAGAIIVAKEFYQNHGYTKKVKAFEDSAACQNSSNYGSANEVGIFRDQDVLDTWFSSALWPFSTMGWPNENDPDYKRFYPTHTLITGFDIIFFWVARMMMMGLHFTGKAPFGRVFINALVRDGKGAKMSKSKGNVMDPLELIDEYGADALRFTMTAMSGQGRDIKLSKARIEGYRNFGTKLWNAHRFAEMQSCVFDPDFDPKTAKLTLNRWVRGEVEKTLKTVTAALEACAFDQAANALYRFVWNHVCDWYVELSKPILNGTDEAAKAETRAMMAWVLRQSVVMLHPVMPFITEALWAETGGGGQLIAATWPHISDLIDVEADAEIDWLIDLITQIRSLRSEMNVPPSARTPLGFLGAHTEMQTRLTTHRDIIVFLGRISDIEILDNAPSGAVPFVTGEATAYVSVAGFIDLEAEKARLSKDIATLDKTLSSTRAKLDNPDFIARAPEAVVEENRERILEAEAAKAKLEIALVRLKTAG